MQESRTEFGSKSCLEGAWCLQSKGSAGLAKPMQGGLEGCKGGSRGCLAGEDPGKVRTEGRALLNLGRLR